MKEFSHILLFLVMKATHIHLLLHCSAKNLLIYIQVDLYLVVGILVLYPQKPPLEFDHLMGKF